MSTAHGNVHRRGRKLRLYPTRTQAAMLAHWCDAARWAWNTCLDWRETLYRRGHAKNLSARYWFAKVLTRWRGTDEHAWLEGVPPDVLAKKLEDQDTACRAFFEGRGRSPRFKRKRDRQSVRVNLDPRHRTKVLAWAAGTIVAPKLGPLRVRGRALPATMAKQLTFSREPDGRWYVAFSVEETITPWPLGANRATGVDLGVGDHATIATDTGVRTVENPRLSRRFRVRETDLHQRLARQVRGSARRGRTLTRLRRLKTRQACCRRDRLHKLTAQSVRESQAIAIEDLSVGAMTRSARGTAAAPGRNVRQKAGLNREVLDVAFGETRRQIEYKAAWHARDVVVVARFDPTSKTCSACGAVNAELALGDRRWTCAGCATEHDREENAAVNIRGYAERTHRGEHGVCAALAR